MSADSTSERLAAIVGRAHLITDTEGYLYGRYTRVS